MSPSGTISEAMAEALRQIRARTYSQDGGCELKAEAVAEIHSIATAALSVPTPGTGGAIGIVGAATNAALCAESDALSTPPAGDLGAVKVKPLTWERTHESSARAQCPVWVWADVYLWEDRWDWRLGNTTCRAKCETIEQAIAEVEEVRRDRILSALSSSPVGEMVLVPREPTEAWVSTLANMRQGQSETPRCEPPTPYDNDIARRQIALVLRAAAYIRERSDPHGGR